MTHADHPRLLHDLAAARVVALELRLLYVAIRSKLGAAGQLTEILRAAELRTTDLEKRLLALANVGADLIAHSQQQDGDDIGCTVSNHQIH